MEFNFASQTLARWPDPDQRHVELLRTAGIEGVLLAAPHEAFAQACGAAGIAVLAESQVKFVNARGLAAAAPRETVALTNGLWPGIARPPAVEGRGDETASASRQPWVDSNPYWYGYLRTLYPERPALLGYVPRLGNRAVPFDTLELALIEARLAGGNYILALEPHYREALLKGDEKARAAWAQLGRTTRWLRQEAARFAVPSLPVITALMEEGGNTVEIANLLYRHNGSPTLADAAQPPAPDPARLALVAVELRTPAGPARDKILSHAEGGGSLIVNGEWWRNSRLAETRTEPDRVFYKLGKGQVIAYKQKIVDPSEFALDVIDAVTHRKRAARLWNAPAVIARATAANTLLCVNYGSPIDAPFPARIRGFHARARMLRPDAEPLELKASRRAESTEVMIPEMRRAAIVVFG